MRIYKDRFYVTSSVPGCSGFQQWNFRSLAVITGHKAARNRTEVVGEWVPRDGDIYIVHDGHLPEHCPRGDADAVREFLRANPFQHCSYPGIHPKGSVELILAGK